MAFYTPLFGWRAADLDQGAGTMLQVPGYGDHLAATVDPGIHERQASAPAGFADVIGAVVIIPTGETPRWHVTFTVADRDDSATTAERLGATVVSSSDNRWTRDALVRDPQGAERTPSHRGRAQPCRIGCAAQCRWRRFRMGPETSPKCGRT
jgi:predicted enzyme related to lactoylglutathione lyase